MSEEMAGYDSAHQQGYNKGYEAGVRYGLGLMKIKIISLIDSINYEVSSKKEDDEESK